jgi:predicted transcriptional regulator
MKKPKKDNTTLTLVTSETLESFFARGREFAKQFDKKNHVKKRRVISFEDPRDLAKFLMYTKLKLVSDVRKKPRSITELSKDLKRSRAAIYKDIQALESVGIIKSEYMTNPGHGRCKMIMAVDKEAIHLQVQTLL